MACPRQNFCGSNLTVCVSSVVNEQGASEIRSRRIMADLTRRKADFSVRRRKLSRHQRTEKTKVR
ncbi:MAG: hypothetical protein N3B10_13410 [Armatimonadetes bacterium]|nr:hypothetical protein [Armatimonadota bacterium]